MKLYLAPLHGVTNRIFRKAYLKHFPGFDAAFAPFILSVSADRMKETHFKDVIPEPRAVAQAAMAPANGDARPGGAASASGAALASGTACVGGTALPDAPASPCGGGRSVTATVPLIPQILGSDAKTFISTANILSDLGYGEVNWNLGCPYPMITKKGKGSGLLPHPDRIEKFLDEVCPRLRSGLSVKLRLGLDSPGEIDALMPILNAHPLARIIIHPRVGKQMYRGTVDLEGFARSSSACAHEVVYNGDITSAETFASLQKRFPPTDGWMIGRGALADPFLPARIKTGFAENLAPARPEALAPLDAIAAFHEDLYAAYREVLFGPAHVLDKMKEVWSYLAPSISGVQSEIADLTRAKTLAEYERCVSQILSSGNWTR